MTITSIRVNHLHLHWPLKPKTDQAIPHSKPYCDITFPGGHNCYEPINLPSFPLISFLSAWSPSHRPQPERSSTIPSLAASATRSQLASEGGQERFSSLLHTGILGSEGAPTIACSQRGSNLGQHIAPRGKHGFHGAISCTYR